MQKNDEFWISCTNNHLFQEINKYSSKWFPYLGWKNINVVCNEQFFERYLIDFINNLRQLRVGFDARFPNISIWISISHQNKELFRLISKIDIYTPRIKIILINDKIILLERIKQIELEANEYSLEIKIINCLFDSESTLNIIRYISNNKLLSFSFFIEWYPNIIEKSKTDEFTNLLEFLIDFNYPFENHPLILCGGISSYIKKILFSMFHSTYKALNIKNNILIKNDYKCSFECIKSIIQKNERLNYINCFCNTSFNQFTETIPFKDKILEKLTVNKSPILFEDWQYISDDFKF
ncbi:hypothetical protein KJ830_04640 [bacterium]|nr:hypothetical protein [bacterium]MBU4510320.1 hypothetical protein [bacterium]